MADITYTPHGPCQTYWSHGTGQQSPPTHLGPPQLPGRLLPAALQTDSLLLHTLDLVLATGRIGYHYVLDYRAKFGLCPLKHMICVRHFVINDVDSD